jgi:hypothetical protein
MNVPIERGSQTSSSITRNLPFPLKSRAASASLIPREKARIKSSARGTIAGR